MVENKANLPLKTPREVRQHCSPSDCWVSIHGKVLDVTQLVKVHLSVRFLEQFGSLWTTRGSGCLQEHEGPLAEPILRAAGTDISHWYDLIILIAFDPAQFRLPHIRALRMRNSLVQV